MSADPIRQGCGDDPLACLLLKLRARDEVSGEEEAVLRSAVAEIEVFRAGKTIIRAGQALNRSALLIDGFVARYKDLSEGQRQIMELHVPGDFTDLHGFPLKKLDHDVGSITRATIAWVPHATLRKITEEQPHLSRLLWMSTLIDAAIQRERILSIGRRAAFPRIAHLLCELFLRLEVIGLTEGRSYALPLTQADLADATGLTSVHVNRMLRQLREEGLLTFRRGRVEIEDWDRLRDAAEFDPLYLHLAHTPR